MSEKTKKRRSSFKEKYELIKEVKAGAPKEFLLKKYCVTDRMYNRVIDNESEIIVKVKIYEFEKKSSKASANINFSYFCSFVIFSSHSTATGQLRCGRHCLSHRSCFLANMDKKK